MSTNPGKWGPDPGWIKIIAEGPTDEEIREAETRIARGESSKSVWADIDARVEQRNRERKLRG